MARLMKQNYMTIKGEKKLNCYHINLSKEFVKQAGLDDKDELNIYAKDGKIIIEKVK